MWGQFAQKIKDLADEITTPVYEDDEFLSNEATIEKANRVEQDGEGEEGHPNRVDRLLYEDTDISMNTDPSGTTPFQQRQVPPAALSEIKVPPVEAPSPPASVQDTTRDSDFASSALPPSFRDAPVRTKPSEEKPLEEVDLVHAVGGSADLGKGENTPIEKQLVEVEEKPNLVAAPPPVSVAPPVSAQPPTREPTPSHSIDHTVPTIQTHLRDTTETTHTIEKVDDGGPSRESETNRIETPAGPPAVPLPVAPSPSVTVEKVQEEEKQNPLAEELRQSLQQNNGLRSEIQELKRQLDHLEKERQRAEIEKVEAAPSIPVSGPSKREKTLELTVQRYKEASSKALHTLKKSINQIRREKRKYERERMQEQRSTLMNPNKDVDDSEEEDTHEEESDGEEEEVTSTPPPVDVRPEHLSSETDVFAEQFGEFVAHYYNIRHIQKQWELTYEQAKEANENMNRQCKEAWHLAGQLREELSVEKEGRAAAESRWQSSQQSLAAAEAQLHTLLEEKHERELKKTMEENQQSTEESSRLQFEMDRLRGQLQAKEEELQEMQVSNENLQHILNSLQQSRARDVEERTLYIQSELEEVKEQLRVAQEAAKYQLEQVEADQKESLQSIARKNMEIASLQKKLSDLRLHFEDSFVNQGGSSSDTVVEKAVVSQLVLKYIQSVPVNPKDAKEVLRILSSLLDWGAEEEEEAGLVPGPLNPVDPTKPKPRFGFLRRGGGGGGKDDTTLAGRSAVVTDKKKRGLATLWVDFLMRQSEGSLGKEAAAATSTASPGEGSSEAQKAPPETVPPPTASVSDPNPPSST